MSGLRPAFFFVFFFFGRGLTEDGREPVVAEVFMMLVKTGKGRGDEIGSRWKLIDEKSLADPGGVKGRRGCGVS